jgi:hypothetical protein
MLLEPRNPLCWNLKGFSVSSLHNIAILSINTNVSRFETYTLMGKCV